jgi:hypothetical protein
MNGIHQHVSYAEVDVVEEPETGSLDTTGDDFREES